MVGKCTGRPILVLGWVLVCAGSALADGGIFIHDSTPLSQTRQEALLAFEANKTMYVVRSLYNGRSSEFAWVLPVPNTPTDVVAHADGRIFTALDDNTRPTFYSFGGGGLGCACGPGANSGPVGQAVQVEAQGQAGIYDWAALSSTGSNTLLDWLNGNGFNVPAAAQSVLDGYIQQGRHFLAVRVREPANLASAALTETPPIQFSVMTTERLYPMVISQISAADQTEVLLYILAPHRAETVNLPTTTIDLTAVRLDSTAMGGTNYDQLFTQNIAQAGGLALITEYAGSNPLRPADWPQAPVGLMTQSLFLTRLRTLIPRVRMTQEFIFRDAASDTPVSSFTSITSNASASMVGEPLTGLLLFGWFCHSWRRRVSRGETPGQRGRR